MSNLPLANLREVIRVIAKFGGFLGCKLDAEPSVKAMWIGLQNDTSGTAIHSIIFVWMSRCFDPAPHPARDAARRADVPVTQLAGHFHDTYGQALANIYAALEVGVQIFHSSVAGLGGCPYAKGATGNVATEDVLYLLAGLGIETGIDLNTVVEAGKYISDHLGRKSNSRVGNALLAKRAG